MKKTSKALLLFITFFKIGLFTFGGGYAMIPLIQKETAEKHKWVSENDILDIIAIAESTPGPIAINAATFIGFKTAGTLGALCATAGVVLPSFLIIFAVSFILEAFASVKPVVYAFRGIRAGVLALIFKAFFNMYKACPKNAVSYIIAGFAFISSMFLSPIAVIAVCAAAGLVSFLIMERSAAEK